MNDEQVLKNARIVSSGEVIPGSLKIKNGLIQALDQGYTSNSGALDLEGDFLLPGFVEVHTDNLEKHLAPRPGVIWSQPQAALHAHDTQIIGAGITTVLDSVWVGEEHEAGLRRTMLELSVQVVSEAQGMNALRAEHLLHLRCEVSDPCVMELFQPYCRRPGVKLVSLMDHTPGQRQFADPAKYRQYYKKQGWSLEEFQEVSARLQENHLRHAAKNRGEIIGECQRLNLPLASHDDTTAEQVEQARQEGVAICEFPTTMAAAQAARQRGMAIVGGAPNLVRGVSHSGNVSVRSLARSELLNILSSDYVPSSMLQAVFVLHEHLDYSLSQATNLVSLNPARVLGLEDRGEIAPGKRADLVRVKNIDGLALTDAVWRQGFRVF
ncbi:MAG: alpha-D-ribose 1-methylphosphonate 5-triphosphate diphosphatase [Desulfarculaceae bacterium]|jgi:alpha-D-ribose 1-methylphosphonate 5-triphosphate diphosphatase